jgi:hypothetical protein
MHCNYQNGEERATHIQQGLEVRDKGQSFFVDLLLNILDNYLFLRVIRLDGYSNSLAFL